MLGGNVNNRVSTVQNSNYEDIKSLKLQQKELQEKLIGYDDLEKILWEAIADQNWLTFRNKEKVVFDCRTGFLFPNFQFEEHIKYRDWKDRKKTYAPNGIAQGQWEILSDVFYYDERTDRTKGSSYFNKGSYILKFDYPIKLRGSKETNIFISKYIDKLGNI